MLTLFLPGRVSVRLSAEAAEVAQSHAEGMTVMQCSLEQCPGTYEERLVVHTVRHRGQVIVIDHVPAEVCSLCGDVLFRPETVRRIEALLQTRSQPTETVPLYEYA